MATTFTKIASVSVGVLGSNTITFTSIPSTYTDLCLKLSGRASGVSYVFGLTFNGSTSSYSAIRLNGNGASASSNSSSSASAIDGIVISGSGDTSSTFGNTEFYIPNYAGSSNKSVSIDNVTENNGSTAFARLIAGLWGNSAAITSITLTASGVETFVQYSTATLYGVSKS
jgi:hypothetical protein